MKKLLIGIAFSFICFSGFALTEDGATWNACGQADVVVVAMAMGQNLCSGTYYIKDICNGGHMATVVIADDGPNSSCGGLPVIPE
ncbi:hypothetical protein [Algoriphagus sp.]|uniref:hypothetical protein n=1 Tax=Algoriphagus sp. TaxID=1872435 RepID=UPI0032956710